MRPRSAAFIESQVAVKGQTRLSPRVGKAALAAGGTLGRSRHSAARVRQILLPELGRRLRRY